MLLQLADLPFRASGLTGVANPAVRCIRMMINRISRSVDSGGALFSVVSAHDRRFQEMKRGTNRGKKRARALTFESHRETDVRRERE